MRTGILRWEEHVATFRGAVFPPPIQRSFGDRTLRRGFQELFGSTVIGYLTEQRLLQAEQLLRYSNLTVAEVVHRCGYSNQGHFAAAFKRKFGIIPKQCTMGKKSATTAPSV